MRVSAEAIHDGVHKGRFIDVVVPFSNGELRGHDDGFPLVAVLEDLQRVTYTKLAAAFDSDAASGSSLRRIQRLIAQCEISTDLIAKLILKLIPVQGPYKLTLDRTNWKFSDTNINILTLDVIYDGMAFPIVFKMMDKRGNSNTQERIELVDRFIRLAGPNSIDHLMADREFIGSEWLICQ